MRYVVTLRCYVVLRECRKNWTLWAYYTDLVSLISPFCKTFSISLSSLSKFDYFLNIIYLGNITNYNIYFTFLNDLSMFFVSNGMTRRRRLKMRRFLNLNQEQKSLLISIIFQSFLFHFAGVIWYNCSVKHTLLKKLFPWIFIFSLIGSV